MAGVIRQRMGWGWSSSWTKQSGDAKERRLVARVVCSQRVARKGTNGRTGSDVDGGESASGKAPGQGGRGMRAAREGTWRRTLVT
jgi:hypothetical protein